MTLKNFFVGRAVVFGILIIVGLGIFAYKTYSNPEQSADIPVNIEAPVFTWKYEADDSLNPDGLPQTNVYLEVSYSGKKMSTLIATTPGSCNDLPDVEDDSVPNSAVAQCYAAGYGDLFKVTIGNNSYLVMHKVFEEASPEYDPVVQQYEVVAEFPFSV